MAIELYWDDDALTTLLCVFDGRWSWSELFAVIKTIKQITADLPHEVAAILDVRKGSQLPHGLFTPQTLENAKQLLSMGNSKTGRIVVVGANGFIRTVFEAVVNLDKRAGEKVAFLDTVKQAREYLKPVNT